MQETEVCPSRRCTVGLGRKGLRAGGQGSQAICLSRVPSAASSPDFPAFFSNHSEIADSFN